MEETVVIPNDVNRMEDHVEPCSICDSETNHNRYVDSNNEIVSTCVVCGHFLKYLVD